MTDKEILDQADAAFAGVSRPDRFYHCDCDECRRYDEILRAKTPDTLSAEDLPMEDCPMSGVSPEGFRYYLPAMIRVALSDEGGEFLSFLVPLYLSSLIRKGHRRHVDILNTAQKYAVRDFVFHARATRGQTFGDFLVSRKVLDRAVDLWRKLAQA